MKFESHLLKNLNNFSFLDDNKVDKGETSKILFYKFYIKLSVRQKSKEILVLLNDKAKLKAERENYSKWKGRIEGVTSSGKVSSVSSSSYSNSVSFKDYNKNYVSNENKKEEPKKIDTESSEDSEEEKKEKKKVIKKEEKVEKIVFDEQVNIKPQANKKIASGAGAK
jgi:hypothetical protein